MSQLTEATQNTLLTMANTYNRVEMGNIITLKGVGKKGAELHDKEFFCLDTGQRQKEPLYKHCTLVTIFVSQRDMC